MSEADRIPTNLRTLLILEVLGQSDAPMTATEINQKLGLPKQTVHRLCATLEEEGFLVRQGNSRRFSPARRLRDLGVGLLHASRSHITRHQVLQDVARQVGETVNFVVPEDTGMRYIDRVETDWAFRIQLPVGSNVPFHCTASGKAFMSTLAPKARRSFVNGLTLRPLTAKTHSSPATLLEDLALSAKRGYALDDEEFLDGMLAIAVPIRDGNGRYLASLAFHGPAQRVTIENAVARKDALVQGATRLRDVLLS